MLNRNNFLAALIIACCALLLPATATAQTEGIAAVVNDDIVSMTDVQDRLTVSIATAGLRDDADIRKKLTPQVLNTLINELLKLQEAKRLKLTVTDDEVENELKVIARSNKQNVDDFLALLEREHVSVDSFRHQIRAELAWHKVVSARLRRQVNVSQEDIAMKKEQLAAQQGQPAWLVSEIFLPVEDPSQDQAVLTLAKRLIEQLRGGAPFAAVAAQFSQGIGARQGGNIGWVQAGQLDPALDKAVRELAVNHISVPIRTVEGWHIMAVRDIREPGINRSTKVHIKQLVFEKGAKEDRNALLTRVQDAASDLKGCDAMDGAIKKSASKLSGDMGTISLGDLNPSMQSALGSLDIGQVSTPIELGDMMAVVMVCDREGDKVSLPSDEDIQNALSQERLDLLQRRYLRDLRSAAFIDRRL